MTERNVATVCLEAMVYEGNRFKRAWLMAQASYAYTRSWHGAEGPDGQPMDFGRWYAFKEAAQLGREWLWRKN